MARAMLVAGWAGLRRDRTALAFSVVVPVAIAVTLGGIYISASDGPARVGVVVESDDPGPVASDLVAGLDGSTVLDTRRYADRHALDRAVLRREVVAGIVVPAALDGLLDRTPPTGAGTVELVGAPGVQAPGGVRAAVEAVVSDTAAALTVARATAPEDTSGVALAAARVRLEAATPGTAGDARPAGGDADQRRGAAGYAIVATVVLFAFSNTAAASSQWAALREQGVLARLRATPASPRGAVAGFGALLAWYALVQSALILGVGWLLFRIPLAAPPALVVTLAALALAAAGVGLLLASVLPTSGAGTTVAGPLAFIAGMVGGCLWPLEIAPPALQVLGRFMPQYWAVGALRAGVVGDGAAALAGPLAVLAGAGLVAGAAGLARLARLPTGTDAPRVARPRLRPRRPPAPAGV